MSYTSYKDMEALIKNRVPFTGNSCRGEIDSSGVYVIYSYQTTIAHYIHKPYVSPRYYSRTTSRLQNIIKRAWELN